MNGKEAPVRSVSNGLGSRTTRSLEKLVLTLISLLLFWALCSSDRVGFSGAVKRFSVGDHLNGGLTFEYDDFSRSQVSDSVFSVFPFWKKYIYIGIGIGRQYFFFDCLSFIIML